MEEKQRGKATGYRFGDLFLNKLTGKDKYEFGDLSRWLDTSVKDRICNLTGKEKYEFGDISRLLDAKAKEQICKLTGKEQYEFGDITREIRRRVEVGDVSPEDLSLLLRALLAFGVGLTPIASFLPLRLLINLLTYNIEVEVGARATGALTTALAEELDRRAKKAIIGREEYELGNFTREQLRSTVSGFTGKQEYEFGDITRSVVEKATGKNASQYRFGDITRSILGGLGFGAKDGSQAPKR